MNQAVVYVFGVPGEMRVKVGFSPAPSVRGQTLRNVEKMPRARLLYALPCASRDQARRIEALAHEGLAEHHIEREWFSVDAEIAIDAIDVASRREPDVCVAMPRGTCPRASLRAKAAWATRRARYGSAGAKKQNAETAA